MLKTEYDEITAMNLIKEEGREEGREEGQDLLASLINKLKALGRVSDVFEAAADPAYRNRLYQEFHMA